MRVTLTDQTSGVPMLNKEIEVITIIKNYNYLFNGFIFISSIAVAK
jgi:hypothetical protein